MASSDLATLQKSANPFCNGTFGQIKPFADVGISVLVEELSPDPSIIKTEVFVLEKQISTLEYAHTLSQGEPQSIRAC